MQPLLYLGLVQDLLEQMVKGLDRKKTDRCQDQRTDRLFNGDAEQLVF